MTDELTDREIKAYRPIRIHWLPPKHRYMLGLQLEIASRDHWRVSLGLGGRLAITFATFKGYRRSRLQLGPYRNA